MSVLLIAASPSTRSRSRLLLEFVGLRLAQAGWERQHLDIRELPAQALLHAQHDDEALAAAVLKIKHAQAIVLATPIYQAAYSGLLKVFLDLLPQGSLAGKMILPIATAGSPAYTLALDYALRPVLSALSARLVLPGVYVLDEKIGWSPDGGLIVDIDIQGRLIDAVTRLIQNLEPVAKSKQKILRLVPATPLPVPFSRVRCSF